MQAHQSASGRHRRPWRANCRWWSLLGCVLSAAGCEEPRQPTTKPIIGQRTQEVKNAKVELQKAGVKAVTPKITAKDPITLTGNAYVTAIGKLSILSIQKAVDLYHATNDRYPKDYDEFMNEIIKANNIALPKLPLYQKYAYDEKEHKLIILEYEELKNQPVQ
jgi:hypothetical protein